MKKYVSAALLLLMVPAVVVLGATVFRDKQYAFVSLAVAVLACGAFFLSFERRETGPIRLVLLAVMTALSVAGRLLFAVLPGFKPVTAMVVLTAMYFGGEAGFLTGALTAVLSNFYFGQGPWTPFQMVTWGLLGFVAGLLRNRLKASRLFLALYGAVAGVAFSLLMDVWTAVWIDGTLTLSRYLAAVATSGGYMLLYALSNVIFLLLLRKPMGEILGRIQKKYGIT
ncbi:MAG: ECF transporter S component [Firmicutes bacterium]|nr:ECF transporter S component [Clostridiales bacterium]MDD7652253.1 ECF transporter S component [Bacillota bacterium]